MDFGVFETLTLIGALGLFLFGMKLMSDSLQKVAGSKMRNILAKMTSNRFKGVITGFMVTCGVQSSSATTVMVVSFVNAGLLSLAGAIGVIMGANIGTTITAWIVTLFGFKVKMSILALPLIALILPMFFSKNRTRKSWAEFAFGFAILFIGLQFLKDSVPDIKNSPEILNFLTEYTHLGFMSTLLFLGVGTLLTIIIQSSSATMALTLVMCSQGWISFDIAAAMVLGENIGTTITANLAAMIANSSAKRAARAHLIFNLMGVIWVLSIFPFFLEFTAWIVTLLGSPSPYIDVNSTPEALSTFHTVFNILNTFFLIWFVKLIERIVLKVIPQKDEEEVFRLQYIESSLSSPSELNLVLARKEIVVYGKRAEKTFRLVKDLYDEKKDKDFPRKIERIKKYEDILDRMEVEIAKYITKVSEAEFTESTSRRIRSMLKLISDIESIGDCCYNAALLIERKRLKKIEFDALLDERTREMFALVEDSLKTMVENLEKEYEDVEIHEARLKENRINACRDRLRKEHAKNIKAERYDYQTGIVYQDMFKQCERIGDYAINVTEAITDDEA